jgi:hypothetical protein
MYYGKGASRIAYEVSLGHPARDITDYCNWGASIRPGGNRHVFDVL